MKNTIIGILSLIIVIQIVFSLGYFNKEPKEKNEAITKKIETKEEIVKKEKTEFKINLTNGGKTNCTSWEEIENKIHCNNKNMIMKIEKKNITSIEKYEPRTGKTIDVITI